MELTVIKKVEPIVVFNKDELKQNLEAELAKYENLVVTADTKTDCKKTRTELNKLKTTIDDFRKDTKKKMSEPITVFESDCKELVSLVDQVIKPVDKQIKAIEKQEKAEKEAEIKEEIVKIIEEYDLDERHASQLTVMDSYLNVGSKMPKILTDLKNRAEVLKVAQNTIIRNKELIKTTCELCNQNLKEKMIPDVWIKMYEDNDDINKTLQFIHDTAKKQSEKEVPKAPLVVEKTQAPEVKKVERLVEVQPDRPIVHVEPMELCKEAKEAPVLEANLIVRGNATQLKFLKDCMEKARIEYEIKTN